MEGSFEMKSNPKVSVIIPTIGRQSLIKTLESVLSQTYPNLEIIITDDTEDYKAKPLIEKYLTNEKIKYVVNKKYKHGAPGNKNNGLDYITGEYITIVDDDDTILPTAIQDLLEATNNGTYKIVYANCSDNIRGKFTGKHYSASEEFFYEDLICGKFEGDYTIIIESSIVQSDRFSDECWGGEWIFWSKLLKKVKRSFYLHKFLKVYSISNPDRVTFTMFKNAERSYLNYYLYLQLFGMDIINICPNTFVRILIPAFVFSRLADKRREMLNLAFKFPIYKYLPFYLYALPWILFCLVSPKFLVKFVWTKTTPLKKTIKALFLLGYKNHRNIGEKAKK
jgi:GalNAc5-diNAcBac-PP-undecaprenol beta-1,3-glucosyltransferase